MWICYDEEKPKTPGWYAVLYCWEIQEGVFNQASYWNDGWDEKLPIGFWWGPFDTAQEAEEYAEESNWDNR